MKGRTFLVTGANSGIGRATAEGLAAMGGTVVLAGRSEEKTRVAMREIAAKHPGADLHFHPLDLADLHAVQKSGQEYLASGRPLDVLINNAGLAGISALSKDGYEITVATNHLGPFLLTRLLLPKLQEAPQGRVVNVASRANYRVKAIDWSDMTTPGTISSLVARYSFSKLLNVLHAQELARRLAGTKVTTYALHPGMVASDAWRQIPWPIAAIMKLFMISNEEGAKTTLYCATHPDLATHSGRYYDECQERTPNRLAGEALAKEAFARTEAAIEAALRT